MSQPAAGTPWKIRIAAALLALGQPINLLSSLCSAALLMVLLLGIAPARPGAMLLLPLLAGGAQIYLALRTAFDASLFRALADAGTDPLEAFDRAMLDLRLMRPGKAGRSIEQRIAGARRLLVLQALAALLQIAGMLGLALWSGRMP